MTTYGNILLLIAIFFSFCSYGQDDTLRLNEVRILASHNSYKKKPDPRVVHFLKKFKKRLGEENDPKMINYGHLPIAQQLNDYNVRGFELDVYDDPKGGRYCKRRVNGFIKGMKKKTEVEAMKDPGFKLLHISDVDYETHYYTFKSALEEFKSWSDAHPGHMPIFVNIESKGTGIGDESGLLKMFGFKKALKYDSTAFMRLNAEIYDVLDSSQVYTPEDLKGSYSSVSERLNDKGWPMLSECRGKIIFILEGNSMSTYRSFIDSGMDVPMFVYGKPGKKSTAFVKRNEPRGRIEEIRDLAKKYIVRTRSDAGTIEARNEDYSRFEACLESDAQIISTDYYKADEEVSDFHVSLGAEYLIKDTR